MRSVSLPSYPAGNDGVLEHAANRGSESPRLVPQQTLHTTLRGQQVQVGETPAAVETEQLPAVDSNISHV